MARCLYVVVSVALLGVALIAIGGGLIPYFNGRISDVVKAFVLMSRDSNAFNSWTNETRFKSIYQEFYFFNVTDPYAIVNTGRNISLVEVGPYVYRVDYKKKNIRFFDDGNLLSYDLYKYYTFERGLSCGSENDVFTAVNFPILTVATLLRFQNSWIQEIVRKQVKSLMAAGNLFINVKVSDLLWGYRSTALDVICNYLWRYCGIRILNDTTFGYFYQSGQPKRTMYMGSFITKTGIDDIKSLWKIKKWNNMKALNYWGNSVCNMINGTDGYSWYPGVQEYNIKTSFIYMFDPEWCRSLPLRFRNHDTSKGGLPVDFYYVSKQALAYGDARAWTRGFCKPTPTQKRNTCLDRGVFNVSVCRGDIPFLLSHPHFLYAAKSVTSLIKHGLQPDAQLHGTNVFIEPVTGRVVEANRTLQLNAYVMRLRSFPNTEKFGTNYTVFPMVWTKEVRESSCQRQQH